MSILTIPEERIILTDIDGVLVHWLCSFSEYVEQLGYKQVHPETYCLKTKFGAPEAEINLLAKAHNVSSRIMDLPEAYDSVKYVKKLAELGFRFIGVTSLSGEPIAKHYRCINLIKHFGNVFDEVYSLEHEVCKKTILNKWENSGLLWIEDNLENALKGQELGLRSRLINRDYNISTDNVVRLSNRNPWEMIYKEVLELYKIEV